MYNNDGTLFGKIGDNNKIKDSTVASSVLEKIENENKKSATELAIKN